MGNGNSNLPPSVDLYAEIAKRKDWFFECQLRNLTLESFRDVEVNDPKTASLLDVISEIQPPADILGSKQIKDTRVYLDSQKPVWTREERDQRNTFGGTFIGVTANWLAYKVPVRLAENLAKLKKLSEDNISGSQIDDTPALKLLARKDPSINKSDPVKDPPNDQNSLSHAMARVAITDKKPWLIPEIFNGQNIETSQVDKWIENGENFISHFENELNEVLGKSKSPTDQFNLGNPDAYRKWIRALLKDSLTINSADAIKVEFLNKSNDTWKFTIKIQTPAHLSFTELKDYTLSDGVKYWINTCINALEEIYINKADSDMGLCHIIRALYLYGTLPNDFGGGQPIVWRNRLPPASSFYQFFASKAKLIVNTPQYTEKPELQDKLLALETKLQILLEETAASPQSGSIHFSTVAQEIIKQAILGYKFWLDEPFSSYHNAGNPGNEKLLSDFNIKRRDIGNAREKAGRGNIDMFSEKEYWSENHYIMFASSEYLAGQLWEKETFQAGKDFLKPVMYMAATANTFVPFLYADQSVEITGTERMKRGKARMLKWLNTKLMFGWTEFNSSGYYREHLMALLNVIDFSLDAEVKNKATLVTDLLFFDLMRFSHKGSMGAAGGRSQFKSKNSGWDNALGDVIEMLLGNKGIFLNRDGDIGCSFATSTYKIPEVLLQIGAFPPEFSYTDRSRVSITFEEAAKYGIQYSQKSDQKDATERAFFPEDSKKYSFIKKNNDEIALTHIGYGAMEDDTVLWWTMSAYFNKEVVKNTYALIDKFGLRKTGVFDKLFALVKYIIPFTEKTYHGLLGAAIGSVTGAGAATIAGAAIGFFLDDILDYSIIEEGSNDLSFFLEGSTRTRANLLTYRNRDVMLSSLQNFRTGQFNFQTNVNQATMSSSVNVFTTAAFADIDVSVLETGLLGGVLGGAASGGFAGAALGGIVGMVGNAAFLKGEKLIADHGDGPGWWTGYWALPMVVQHESAAIIAYDFNLLQKKLADAGSHVWFPKNGFDKTEERRTSAYEDDNFVLLDIADIGPKGFWLFGKVVHATTLSNPDANEEGYIGVFSNQRPEWLTYHSDFYKDRIKEKLDVPISDLFIFSDYFADQDWYVSGKNIWIIQVGSKNEFGSFDNFKDRVSKAKVLIDDAGDMECSYSIPKKDGSSQVLALKYGDGGEFSLDGSHFQTDFYPRFENPFIRGGRVEWGQREYVIEYNGKILIHDFSNLASPLRMEDDTPSPEAATTIKGLVIYLKTEDEEMEIRSHAMATVHIGCQQVAVNEVIAAGKVGENTFHDAEWILFDMPAISNPDMTIDIYHNLSAAVLLGEDSDTEWKMTFRLMALMGDRSLKPCTARPIPLEKFYLRKKYRKTGLVPFSVQLSLWRTWRMLESPTEVQSWMMASQPGKALFYFDYIDQFGINKDHILMHRKLGPCAAASPWTNLNSQDKEPATKKNYSLFTFSTQPAYLFVFLMSEGSFFSRWLFPGNTWSSNNWQELNISYQPMLKLPFMNMAVPDTSSPPLPVPLGLHSRVCAACINLSTLTPAVFISGADGNLYVSSKWPLEGLGNWRQIETASVFKISPGVDFQVIANHIFTLDDRGSLWRYFIKPGEEDILAFWQQLPLHDFIIQSFTVAISDDKLLVIACSTKAEVWAINLNEGAAFTGWQRVGENLHFKTAPEAQVSCASATTGRVDIFVCGTDGKLYTTWWNEEAGWENGHNWVVIASESHDFKATANTELKAISRVNGQIEIYATDSEQNTWTNWWS
ncbi:MAG: hypothetical protein V4714_11985 [Bacteroidota bacterium]